MKTLDKSQDKRAPLNKDVVLLIKGLIVGKVLTLAVIGGVLWWLRPHLWNYSNTSFERTSVNGAATASNFQSVTNVPIGSFNYGGSTAWVPIRQVVDAQIQNARPELQLRYLNPTKSSNPGSSSGIQMLLDGQVDFAQSSRLLTPEEKAEAQARGIAIAQRPVALDALAVVVHPSLQVPGLTIDQLQQIYQGKITNWSQVGGPNLPIKPFSQRPESGDTVVFSGENEQFAPHVKFVSTTTQALRQVSQTPGSLYYASARAVVPQCSVKPLPIGRTAQSFVAPYREALVSPQQCPTQRNQLNLEAFQDGSYPITRKLFVTIKQNQGKEQQAGEAYTNLLLTAQGQKAMAQAGFIGLR